LARFHWFHYVGRVIDEHHADGVDGIMPIEAFVHEA
jgi:hypothetical protein